MFALEDAICFTTVSRMMTPANISIKISKEDFYLSHPENRISLCGYVCGFKRIDGDLLQDLRGRAGSADIWWRLGDEYRCRNGTDL